MGHTQTRRATKSSRALVGDSGSDSDLHVLCLIALLPSAFLFSPLLSLLFVAVALVVVLLLSLLFFSSHCCSPPSHCCSSLSLLLCPAAIQGDGINFQSVKKILAAVLEAGTKEYCPSSLSFLGIAFPLHSSLLSHLFLTTHSLVAIFRFLCPKCCVWHGWRVASESEPRHNELCYKVVLH